MIDTWLISKYCEVDVSGQVLRDAIRTEAPTVASELRDVLTRLTSTEEQLARLLPVLEQDLRGVEQNLTAGPGDRAPLVESVGVLQARAPRLDALVARRAAQIEHLQSLTRVWVAQQADPPATSTAQQ
ncbi:hypothetical protein C1I95_23635 [Micromonospora craterilacus]|uniref:Uncharacterized protein n=1 Tax=Micromonospora craterilacus TaxID=1655439 RepID=A0A2W2EM07_9ACTN|nr:hypothetical protein [Micromonospora craterilacus]PZG13448.1 hypothetical protein C1I95_23635 [Micromonospora craterilacus]